jgi:hypothetical protein
MLVREFFFYCTALYRLTLLVMAGWQPAAARKVAEASDGVTDPQAGMPVTEPQAVATAVTQTVPAVDPQLAGADPAVVPQLLTTESADPAVLTAASGQIDVLAVQLGSDASGNGVTPWGWKPPFVGNPPPGLGATGAGGSCGGGGCRDIPNSNVKCDTVDSQGKTNMLYSIGDGRFVPTDFKWVCCAIYAACASHNAGCYLPAGICCSC